MRQSAVRSKIKFSPIADDVLTHTFVRLATRGCSSGTSRAIIIRDTRCFATLIIIVTEKRAVFRGARRIFPFRLVKKTCRRKRTQPRSSRHRRAESMPFYWVHLVAAKALRYFLIARIYLTVILEG